MKTEEEIVHGNRLIAEWCGFSKCVTEHDTFWKENGEPCTIDSWDFHDYQLAFNSDWNWLMAVVEKIESLGYRVEIIGISCAIVLRAENIYINEPAMTRIKTVWQAVVEFVKWYNEQKSLSDQTQTSLDQIGRKNKNHGKNLGTISRRSP